MDADLEMVQQAIADMEARRLSYMNPIAHLSPCMNLPP